MGTYISSIIDVFQDSLIIANQNQQDAKEMMKKRQSKLKQTITFQIGDIVLLYNLSKQNVHGDKFTERWISPKLGNSIYKLRDKLGKELPSEFHADRLRHYKQRQLVI